MPHPTVRVAVSAGVLVLLAALAGCGTDPAAGPPGPPVANLPQATPSGTATSPPQPGAESDRPQLRLDSSDEEVDRLWAAYNACLKNNGHKMNPGRGPDAVDMEDKSPQSLAANRACANTLPRQPPELDEATNPDYQDDYRDYITCLRSHGMKIHAVEPFGTGWTYDDNATTALSSDEQTTVDKNCTREAFGAQ